MARSIDARARVLGGKMLEYVWTLETDKGARAPTQVPKRIRVRISREHNDNKDADEDLYSYVTVVDTPNGFKGLGTEVVDHE
jgi:ribosomal protein L31E